MRILLIGAPISDNFGGPSILSGIIDIFSDIFDDVEYILLSPNPQEDTRFANQYGVKIFPAPIKKQKLILFLVSMLYKRGIDVKFFLDDEAKNAFGEFLSADLIVDIWGILYADQMGGNFGKRLIEGIHLPTGKSLDKPVIKYTSDLGPFNSFWNGFFARSYLRRCDLIIARNETSRQNLLQLGILNQIDVCPDTAFIMNPNNDHYLKATIRQEKDNDRLIVGISVSHTIENKELYVNQYSDAITQLIKKILGKYNAHVIIIPNELNPKGNDDLAVAHKIMSNFNTNAKNVIIVENKCPAPELKAIINECDIMISARYHSIVASLSLGIPTLAISWHHKYKEILSLFNQEKYICDIQTLNSEKFYELVDELIFNREQIASEINLIVPTITERILAEREIIKSILTR